MKNILQANFFSLFGLFWVILGWLALLLTFLGFFYISIITFSAISLLAFFLYLTVKKKYAIKIKSPLFLASIFSLIIAIAISFFTVPSIFSGRDEGTFSGAAIILSKNHTTAVNFEAEKEFFHIYGSGEALNFPGWNYDQAGQLVPHFPLGYISWLAVFYSLFSLSGFAIANSISLILFLVSFFLVAKNYLKNSSAFFALILCGTAFTSLWFSKFTLSENLAWGLIWFGILEFILFLKEKNKFYFFSFLLSFSLLLFVRIEAFAFLLMALVVLFLKSGSWKNFRQFFDKKTIALCFFIILTLILSFVVNESFYQTFVKGFLNSFNLYQEKSAANSSIFSPYLYITKIFSLYALLNYVLLGILSLFYFLKKKNFEILIPLFILLPSFIYLINPSISFDHPWMLRRFAFSIIPITILYTIIFLDHFFKRKLYLYLIFILFLLSNLVTSLPFLFIKENNNLLQETEKISRAFKQNDLILVDREASGNAWSMISGPLSFIFQKQAIYFFNPNDLEKINLSKFENIYLIIPDNNLEFYYAKGLRDKLFAIKDYKIETSSLEIFSAEKKELYKNSLVFPPYTKNYTYGKIYIYKK